MNTKHVLTTGLLLGGFALAGCMKAETDPSTTSAGMTNLPPATPTTKPVAPPEIAGRTGVTPAVPATKPAEAAKPAPPKDMTHVVTAEQPYFAAMGGAPTGTLKKGTKVLLVIPGEMAQVEMADGTQVYTKNEALETVAEANATHVLSKDQPYFKTMPAEGAKPAGMLKAGTKMLLLIPGSMAQVETTSGQTVYTPIDGVELIPVKK
jgi:hypothetical protein